MSKKEKIKDIKGKEETNKGEKDKEKIPEPMKYGVAPSLIINMVRETRVYRFEMPIGAHLDECEEACNECLVVVKKMKEEAQKKMDEEAAKKKKEAEESESSDEDIDKK